MKKELRLQVYNKYGGHCAYCGKEIKYEEMEVDHIFPKRSNVFGVDNFENLNPACRRCNHYKRGNLLETFRKNISKIPQKLSENYIFKVGVDYNLISAINKEVVFYFEHINKEVENG